MNIIKAPTGSGKTYFALTAIPSAVPDATHKVLYLIDTINGKEQILQNYNARPIYRLWETEVNGINFGYETEKKIVIITYAKFGSLLEKDPDFHKNFDYIICDELHSLINFQYFSPPPNLHTIAKSGLERAVNNDHTIVVALSATPDRVINEFNTLKNIIPIDDKEIIRYEVKQIENYTNLDYLLSALDPAETGICYVSHIHTMKDIEATARKLGFHPISLWSVRNTDHPMNQEQMNVRKAILKTFIIPPQYDLLIINASSETSLKIKSPVDYVIVHSNKYDTQVQVRGRVNNDLARLYLPTNAPDALTVPAEYLNRPLFSKGKTKLCKILNIRNPYNRRFCWTTIHSMLLDCDYCISEGRRNNKRYTIITLPAE